MYVCRYIYIYTHCYFCCQHPIMIFFFASMESSYQLAHGTNTGTLSVYIFPRANILAIGVSCLFFGKTILGS